MDIIFIDRWAYLPKTIGSRGVTFSGIPNGCPSVR